MFKFKIISVWSASFFLNVRFDAQSIECRKSKAKAARKKIFTHQTDVENMHVISLSMRIKDMEVFFFFFKRGAQYQ